MNNKKNIFEKLGIVERMNSDLSEITEPKTDSEPVVLNSNEGKNEGKKVEPTFNLDRFFSIQEIYNKLNMPIKVTDTVFIVDSFLKALPENLPTEIKRQSVLNVISASGMQLQSLIHDGNERLKALNFFIDSFTEKTEDTIDATEKEIDKLLEQINKYKELINKRKTLQEEQKATIDYEIQKILSMVKFIEP
ncbi:MAG: hypothetical protein AB7G87_14770 [Clostridia bacterium]